MAIIDFHCDTIAKLYENKGSLRTNTYHVDLEKLKASKYLAQWFAIFIDKEQVESSLIEKALEMLTYFKEQLTLCSDTITLATSYEAYERIKKQQKIAAFLSLEEGQVIEGSLENLIKLVEEGIRLMTLTWNYENTLAAPHWSTKGLTSFGKEVAQLANTLPLLLDISHASEGVLKDLQGLYHKPIVASHSNAYAIYPHTRNLSDGAIRQVAESGGVIGINFYSVFLDGSMYSTIEAIERHLNYILKVGGEEVIALGSDFDGIVCKNEVCHAGEMGKLTQSLSKKYSPRLIEKWTYQNAERLLRENF
ncbi:peptidase M19 [Sporanaerobium hydrogeniformans]|uniref:Peptidase M19 n=1 Tax=Sporanaerobium hydrogeniformans TaxID=3072179 RepID=A0AC61DCK5_9FIRM|nr:dipeptidase [Sporanaerobium hydrogeniformans]PHV71044.1 peptidase M19 [Sporanaerobium hydrogeniformans]